MSRLGPAVYRLYDKEGRLLYVGCSTNVLRRIYEYSVATWYRQIDTVKIEHFATLKLALDAEKAAIFNERPIHNSNHMDWGSVDRESHMKGMTRNGNRLS